MRKKVIAALVAAVVVFAVAIAVRPRQTAHAAQLNGGEIADTYMIGDILDVPAATLTHNGVQYAADFTVKFPDGRSYTGQSIELDTAGVYKIEYRAITGRLLLAADRSFSVTDKLYSVSGDKSSLGYGSHPYAPDKQGVILGLANGETFRYNEIIDLSDFGASDTLLKLFVTPAEVGKQDANKLVVTFTDAYDPSNIVTVTGKVYDSDWVSTNGIYMTACATGQPPTGIEPYSGTGTSIPVVVYEGKRYRLHRSNEYGSWAVFSFMGTPDKGGIGDEFFEVRWDYAERRVYGTSSLICDLDESLFFTSLWDGFTTGEVYMSIHAEGYQNSLMNMVITDIGDRKLSDNVFCDVDAPTLTVDYADYTASTVPDAQLNRPYRVFDATAYDSRDGQLPVTTKVYYNYRSTSKARIPVDNGVFTPPYPGEYTIEYTATDLSGNTAYQTVSLTAREDIVPLALTIGQMTQSGEAGQLFSVAVPEVVSHYPMTHLSVTAEKADGSESYVIGDDFTFRPLSAGTFTIRYVASDYVYTVSRTYSVTIIPTDKSVIIDEARLPRYFIKNCTYTLPGLDGLRFTDGIAERIPAAVSVSEDGGAQVTVTGRYKVTANNTVTVTYTCPGGGSKSYTRPVADTGYGDKLDMTAYFAGDFIATALDDRIRYQTDTGGGTMLEFINDVLADNILLSFDVPEGYEAMDAVHWDISDSVSGETVRLTYRSTSSGTNFSVNGGNAYPLEKGFGTGGDAFSPMLNTTSATVSPTAGVSIPIESYISGAPFTGFDSRYVVIRAVLEGVSGSAALEILSLNRQEFSSFGYDLVAPELTRGKAAGIAEPGSEIIVIPAYAADVLDPDITFKMYVTGPDRQYVKTVDGQLLDGSAPPDIEYRFIAEQYGRYTVYYEATDTNGETAQYNYTVNVADTVPPVITPGSGKTEVKVGDTVAIAGYEVSDNTGESVTVTVWLTLPDSRIVKLETPNFKATAPGRYTIIYYALDAAGNPAYASYEVVAT